jgi:hypothetical protein
LIPLTIIHLVWPANVGGKWNVPDGFNDVHHVTATMGLKPDRSTTEKTSLQDFRGKLRGITEFNTVAGPQLLTGMHQGFPAFIIEPSQEQTFDGPAAWHPPTQQPRRHDLRVIDDEKIAAPQPAR